MSRSAPSGAADRDAVPPLDRQLLVLVSVLVVGGLMVVLDTTVLSVAIGPLSDELDASLPVIQWVLTGYTLALAAVIPVMAWAVARLGARRVFLLALGCFTAASAMAGLAWDVNSLIAFRVVQGLGGGLLVPVAMTIALRAAHPSQKGRVMGLLGIPVLIGPVVGPTLGGLLLDTASWRSIFFVNVPIGVLAIVLGLRALPRDRPSAQRPLDVAGLLMLSPGLAALVYGVARAGEQRTLTEAGVVLPSLLGAALVGGFVVRATRIKDPLVAVRLLQRSPMGAGTVVLALFAAAYFGSAFLGPLYFQIVRGESATVSGLISLPQALATGISLQVASRLIDRMPPHRVVAAGVATATAGFALFAAQLGPATPYWTLMVALALAGAGVGATLMPIMTTAARHLPHDDVPSGTALLHITSQAAVSFGAAAVSVLLATNLTTGLPDTVRNGVGDVYGLPATTLDMISEPLAAAFRATYFAPVALMATALIATLVALPRRAPLTDNDPG